MQTFIGPDQLVLFCGQSWMGFFSLALALMTRGTERPQVDNKSWCVLFRRALGVWTCAVDVDSKLWCWSEDIPESLSFDWLSHDDQYWMSFGGQQIVVLVWGQSWIAFFSLTQPWWPILNVFRWTANHGVGLRTVLNGFLLIGSALMTNTECL